MKSTKQIQLIKKEKFIEQYKLLHGNITDSCKIVGIDRGTYYNWIKDDPDFLAKVSVAESELNDKIRKVLITKAQEGDLTAVIFYLKNRHPDFKQQTNFYQQNNFTLPKKDYEW